MNSEIWTQCVSNWEHTLECFKRKGADVTSLSILPGVPEEQMRDFEQDTGLKLPEDFIKLLKLSGGVRFDWSPYVRGGGDDLEPPVQFADYGGNSEYELIGASESTSLLDLYYGFQEEYEERSSALTEDRERQRAMVRRCFPLYVGDGDGNALVMRLDTTPCQIHVLRASICWWLSEPPNSLEPTLAGMGLADFLLRWSQVGSPALYSLLDAVKACGGDQLDPASDVAKEWLQWLEDPNQR